MPELLSSLTSDFLYALKGLRRAPSFAIAAILTIGLGVGANTAVFSLLHSLLFQPLDAARPEQLVRIYTSEGHAPRDERDFFGASSYADYLDLQRSAALNGVLAYLPVAASVDVNHDHFRVEGRIVSGNYFALLGRPLLVGGWQSDGGQNRAAEVVVSYPFFKSRLNADPSAIGRTIEVNGRSVRIVGVTSPEFRGIELSDVAMYFPFASAAAITGRPELLTDRSERSVHLVGRLAAGSSPEGAEQSLGGIMTTLGQEFPASNEGRTVRVRRATSIVPTELMGGAVYPTAGLVFAATLVMLAIAGVNISAVLLSRTIRRRRELAVRLSLGASRGRVIRQLVTESLTLALAAAAVVVVFLSFLPAMTTLLGAPAAIQPVLDESVLGYAIVVAVGFGLLFGMAPAFLGLRSDVVNALRGGESGTTPAKARAQRVLVAAQIALSVPLLLVSAGLLESLARQQKIDPGFVSDHLVVATFEDPTASTDPARERAFVQLAAERLQALPGVQSMSVASMAPLTGDGMRSTTGIPGYQAQANESMDIPVVTAGPDFFKTLGVPILRGREVSWSEHDTLSRVVVNQSMARKYWGARDPIGSLVELGGRGGRMAEVIGVSGDVRFVSLAEAPQPMYVVQRSNQGGGTVLIRTRGDASALLLAVRGSMGRSDVPWVLARLETMQEVLRNSLVVTRALSQTLMTMGLLALLLASVGLYGVVSYVMAGRTREFGIRLALGATPGSIARLVLRYGVRLTLVGSAIGVVIGLGAVRLIQSMLFGGVLPSASSLLLICVICGTALVACGIPAVRARGIEAGRVLRED